MVGEAEKGVDDARLYSKAGAPLVRADAAICERVSRTLLPLPGSFHNR